MINDVICPSCSSVTPPWRYCIVCNSDLDGPLQRAAASGVKPKKLTNVLRKRRGKTSRKMDAHLHRQVARTRKQGIRKLANSSTKENELAVIAKVKVKHLKAIERLRRLGVGLGEVRAVAKNADGTMLVTARIPGGPVSRSLWKLGAVSLNGARRIRPLLERTTEETHARADLLPSGNLANGGKGVIIGVVDFGLDFVHRNFRRQDGSTRILALWDQKAAPDAERSPSRLGYGPFEYGRLFLKDAIDAALDNENPYEALGYEPSRDSIMGTGAHGTYVADVAAGNGLGASKAPGVAPQADIIFVDLSTAGTPLQGSQAVGSTFGDSAQLLDAIEFIFDAAGNRPCVVNLSLGTNGGPHDGSSPVEAAIDQMVSVRPNRAVVIAAGNSFDEAIHVTGRVPDGGRVDVKWQIPPFDSTGNELELWYAGEDRFTVELIDPDGRRMAMVRSGETWEKVDDSQGLVTVVNRVNDPNNYDNTINVFFEGGPRDGVWTLRLHGDSASNGWFHAWVERDERGQSRFVLPQDDSYEMSDEHTLGSIACGGKSIVVGAYNAGSADLQLYESSSSGPTRDGRCKPDISAPGELVLAAHSGTVVLRHRQSGTSVAAAVVSGIVALMLAEAQTRGIPPLTSDKIRQILIRTARKNPPTGEGWHPRYGYGRVCAAAAVAAVRDMAPSYQESEHGTSASNPHNTEPGQSTDQAA